ncbi:hypothetical protein COCCADRAFT_41912 [Bipolaris zeicola 26-R-13]|uniref:Uncharacterized protein n=1 Tax=Cochliobolus carbonum (strain 26-R-13) TaxID=930089 RepID=W6XPA9_COCC2|nr:uncharacterized protein COCCADRAFT_41912 [Bipolaris zeicola 26-R-13]EUC27343.1 hypothetical protein COCCADRAFT_41912 [Bipolaris zeicola 26-R-13]
MANMFSLHGKNVVITGAGGSIGMQIALLFADAGASTLTLIDSSSQALSKLERAFTLQPRRFDCKLMFEKCDMTDEKQLSPILDRLDAYGGIDVMVNNAGVFPTDLDGDAIHVSLRAWELTYQVNVLGTWLGCKHAILSMRRNKKTSGSVINVSSVAGLVGSATAQLAYTASKGAVIAMTRELGIVHAKEGYRFNCLCPAPLDSPMLNDFLDADDEPTKHENDQDLAVECFSMNRRQRREVHLPQGRFGNPVEVAGAALFLACTASSFVNSTELVVDGGLTKAFVTPEGPRHYSQRHLRR